MRILDKRSDESLSEVTVILTVSEASELRDSMKQLLIRRLARDHVHINDREYKKEITVSIYDISPLETYHPRFQKLILEDK
jgi:hypothetical protein